MTTKSYIRGAALAVIAGALAFASAVSASSYIAPADGSYTFNIGGAQGGANNLSDSAGGFGATVSATFSLTSGTVIDYVIGGRGNTGNIPGAYGGGGGGGTA